MSTHSSTGDTAPAVLVLEDGRVFRGRSYGAEGTTFGEAVFSTGMSGYQETLTDPSYHRQIVVATAPHIGNTGWNDEDDESRQIWVAGLVVRDIARRASNWRSRRELADELRAQGIVAITGLDTRALTRHLRERGAMRAGVFTGDAVEAPVDDLVGQVRRSAEMTGADLANVLNEAALLTARSDKQFIDDATLDEAIDRVIAGPQKRTRIMSAQERKITAYHEGGHALVAAAMNHTDPVTKITILPRGRALGYTMVLPVDDKYSTTRNEILDQLAYALGGRVAEEIIFHDPSTGASNDIEKATSMARKMVTEFGMSERIGAVKLGQSQGEVFLGRDMGHQRDYSETIAGIVDEEVRRFIEDAHDEAWHALNDNRDILDRLVLDLLEHETLNAKELAKIFADVVKRPKRPTWLSSEHRTISTIPPVLTPAEREAVAAREAEQTPAGDSTVTEAIDRAAEEGASLYPQEHPTTEVREVPPGEQVDGDGHA